MPTRRQPRSKHPAQQGPRAAWLGQPTRHLLGANTWFDHPASGGNPADAFSRAAHASPEMNRRATSGLWEALA
eukprot:6397660-Lingulodinium_polyedra.AAC.1